MAFTVNWIPSAETRLTEIWIASRDRKSIADATNQIDSLLRLTPLEVGESRASSDRIVIVPPLSVLYSVPS